VIAETDQRLLDWAAGLVDTPASLSPPDGGDRAEGGISIYLLDFAQEPLARGARKPPLQLSLRYLVSVGGRDAAKAHGALWRLLVEAVRRSESDDWAVEREPPPLEVWRALGVAPRAAFVLRVQARHEWEQAPPARRVTERVIEGGPVRSLAGVVVGPGATPLGGVMVDLPSLGQSVETDPRGRFVFPSVPGGEYRPRKLVVRAKGETRDFDVPGDADAGAKPLVIEFKFAEV
jgi:hypothetical protein